MLSQSLHFSQCLLDFSLLPVSFKLLVQEHTLEDLAVIMLKVLEDPVHLGSGVDLETDFPSLLLHLPERALFGDAV